MTALRRRLSAPISVIGLACLGAAMIGLMVALMVGELIALAWEARKSAGPVSTVSSASPAARAALNKRVGA